MKQYKTALRRLALLVCVLAALTAAALAADYTADSPKALYDAMEQALRVQKGTFSVAYTGNAEADGLLPSNGSPSLGLLLRQMSAQSPDGPDNADYPSLNVNDGKAGFLNGAFYFEIEYLATPAELDEVSRRAKEIVAGIDLSRETDYTKVKLLYEYLCTHYVYDDSLTKFSAYDGLTTGSMVCQGYALLAYRVMWEAGIPCRIITGTSGGENHAWNIVKLDGRWYNLDATWDAAPEIGGVMSWTYFLKSPTDFRDHTRFSPYTTDSFEADHPMSQTSWVLPEIKLTVNGDSVGSLVLRKGVEVQLEAKLPQGVLPGDIQWICEDPALVTVTADGRMVASTLGATRVTVQLQGNRGVISAQLPVQAVDLTTASGWAFDTVTSYYLNQLLPPALCTGFQQPITREQLAVLLDHFVIKTAGYPSFSYRNTFDDIDTLDSVWAISNCVAIHLMDGMSATKFGPQQTVTREQAAKVLVRLAEFLDEETYVGKGTVSGYADAADIRDWAAPFVAAATELKLIQGVDGQFQPKRTMTLEQMIIAMDRVYARWEATQRTDAAA